MAIERCICENRSFEEILRLTREKTDLNSVHALRSAGICCTGCRLCAPYIAEMLRTGRTSFEPGETLPTVSFAGEAGNPSSAK